MTSKKEQIKLLESLHRSYSDALSQQFSEETKDKIKNLLEMIEAVTSSLEKTKHETKLQRVANRLKKTIDEGSQ